MAKADEIYLEPQTSACFRVGFYNFYNTAGSSFRSEHTTAAQKFFRSLSEVKLKEPTPAELHLSTGHPAVQVS